MKARIASLVGDREARQLWMGTFHSVFIRFLRLYADRIGFPSGFTIYNTSDTKSAVKSCIRDLQLDAEVYKPNEVASRISKAKNNLMTPEAYASNPNIISADSISKRPRLHEIYTLYSKKCKAAGAMDFDDILLYANILFRDCPDVLSELSERFRFILVDEYQDTNYSQYLIVRKLSAVHRNICVVGDDAQSIYAFRGARIENILNFRKDYPDAKEYRLEQNYRSTQNIVNAANSLISHNAMQLKKKCFSEAETGEKIAIISAYTEQEEGFSIASSIINRMYADKCDYSSFAVLYRTNAQSRAIEEALRKRGIPYKIFSGQSFYDRAEVKDMLAYLRLVVNPKDDEAFKRVVNFPARGIGETSMSRLSEAALSNGISLWEAVADVNLESFGLKNAAVSRIRSFVSLIASLHEKAFSENAYELAVEIAVTSGVMNALKADSTIEGEARLQNVEEFLNSIKEFCESVSEKESAEDGSASESGDVSVSAYLENVSLLSDMDRDDDAENRNKVTLMTVHSSKGLEFPHVYISGMEEMLFPSVSSVSGEDEVEEERRLFYVALTRAEKSVTLTYSRSRFKWGNHTSCKPSRFISEIDSKFRDDLDDGDDFMSEDSLGRFGMYGSERSFSSGVYKDRKSEPVHRMVRPTMPPRPADPSFKADSPDLFYEGASVEHDRFGTGVISSLSGSGSDRKAVVQFDDYGEKTLLLKFAKMRLKK